MKKIFQTTFNSSNTSGNCLRASIASVLSLNIEDLPKFELMEDGRWKHALVEWAEKNKIILDVYNGDVSSPSPYLAIGQTVLGGKHCCVYQVGELIHDPHPSGLGLSSVKNTIVLRRA